MILYLLIIGKILRILRYKTYNSVTTSLSNNTSTQTISNLTNLMISDLTGIEDFSNLEGFNLEIYS